MFPVLIDLGTHELPLLGETHLFLPTYGVLFASGALLAWWWFIRRGRTLGLDDDRLFNLSFYTLLAGILGAKLTLVVLDWQAYLADPRAMLGLLRSAGVLMGGVIGGGLVFTWYALRNELPLHRLGDAIAAPLALAQAIGRLGCFAAGCCWGVQCDPRIPLAVTFTNAAAYAQTGVPLNVARVPTQLIQMANDLLLALLLTWLWKLRIKPAGTVFWVYVLLYSVTRGIIEFWRGDAGRGVYLGGTISTSQWIAIGGVVLAGSMIAWSLRRRPG